jgi:FtsH-binding integral membrane protein
MKSLHLQSHFIFTILGLILLSAFTYSSAFKNNKPTCNNFVINVYLYLALSLTLVGVFIHLYNYLLNKNGNLTKLLSIDQVFNQIKPYYILSVIFSFVFIILISIENIYNTKGFTYHHITWVLFIACISLTLYPYFKSQELYMYVNNAIIMTIMIFIIMSSIVYLKPELFEKTYSTAIVGLLVALLAVIIVELSMIFMGNYDYKTYRMISYFVILLFSLFVSYDTTKMFIYAKNCINSPNYPKASVGFFLDLINLFVRLVGVNRR